MSRIQMDNTGGGKLQVPGFDNIPVDYELDIGQRFAHGALEHWRGHGGRGRATRLTQPEVLMLRVMERVTEKPSWERDVFDENVVAQWYADALSHSKVESRSAAHWDVDVDMDLVTPRTWEWCIAELRDKAIQFQKISYILTLNADSGVCKSDMLVGMELQSELREAFQHLLHEFPTLSHRRDHSNPVHDLVDPSLFMLVYGRTAVLSQGGQVTMADGGLSYPTTTSNVHVAPTPEHPIDRHKDTYPPSWRLSPDHSNLQPFYRWSNRFQWLPCEVEFAGLEGTEVRITSYINNLHPNNRRAYTAIEKLISLCLEPWNEVLIKGTTSRFPLRIKTYGFETSDVNDRYGEMHPDRCEWRLPNQRWTKETWDAYCLKVKEYLALPEPDQKYWIIDIDPSDPAEPDDLLGSLTAEMWASSQKLAEIVDMKWRRLHTFHYPEAGLSYSYEDWKRGKTVKPIVEKRKNFSDSSPGDHQYQSVCLQDEFRREGLQVIVRVSSIELTPENPSYAGDDDFHVDGFLNEHIVATARYYYDVENLTEARISFQQEDDLDPWEMTLEPHAMHKIFGLPRTFEPFSEFQSSPPDKLQTLGSVAVHQGRLLAWPNTLRYKTRPFSLKDTSRPGHQRCIVIWLVDPHYRICSTRNVPAQQHDWWREAVLANMATSPILPPELADLIMDETGNWPMGLAEAEMWKKESEAERHRAIQAQSRAADYYDFWRPIAQGER